MKSWPTLTYIEAFHADVPSPLYTGAELDLHVQPCGEEAWEVFLLLYKPGLLEPGYAPLPIVLQDCLDFSRFSDLRIIPVTALESPGDLVVSAAHALADTVARQGARVQILNGDTPTWLKVRFTVATPILGAEPRWESQGECFREDWLAHIQGQGK